ncbi:CaiB/BaiF CoA-transferase family protein [Pseudoxanthomonas sp. SL93]|uniref:CaiB/BaiF CoA transferase family protein n=1 Tax=Pseudoxanthomonas sp. SL93 TaxID=2995142 RepID=UPI002271E3CD|nr:CaiB/BaiF CoA-transferase family protein [Pseudoxanthomonas sp. SL93]WAC62900.1 CaiB/BaiF CoA-transferase family protein [Pseudoxanthomonas sp. SL93]
MTAPVDARALQGIRVLDLTRVLAGPWCTQVLADLGAEVIKVERPGTGDDTRGWGPPFLRDGAGEDTAESAYFLCTNRNKRSLTVDIAQPAGQAIIRRLAGTCDVLVENFKVGDMARHGLDAATLRALNPRLVYCSITGFGQDGPYAQRAGYDFAVQGLGGLMSVTGAVDGEPQKVGVAVADLFTGMYATVAILAALRHRDATGEGQVIDMALLDTQVAMLANLGSHYLVGGEVPSRQGNAHANIVPYQVFAVADGHLIVAVGNDRQFTRLCDLLDLASLAQDARYATNAARVRHRETLVPVLQQALHARGRQAWLSLLETAGIPCGPVNDLRDVFADPQVRARGMVVETPHPMAGTLPLVGSPMKLSATPVQPPRTPPGLGQDSDDVLREAGYGEEEIAALRAGGVV